MGDTTIVDGSTAFTIAVWVNFTAQTTSDRLVTKWGNVEAESSFLMTLDDSDSNEILCGVGNAFSGPSDIWKTSDSNLATGTWYHIACTWTDTTRAIYVNGASVSITTSADQVGSNVRDASSTLNVCSEDTGARNFISAKFSDVAIWNAELSSVQVAQLALSKVKGMPYQIAPANLKIYIPFNDQSDASSGDGDTYIDRSGNGINGTGNDGANNTGMTNIGEEALSYP